jgi:hypothetical protein
MQDHPARREVAGLGAAAGAAMNPLIQSFLAHPAAVRTPLGRFQAAGRCLPEIRPGFLRLVSDIGEILGRGGIEDFSIQPGFLSDVTARLLRGSSGTAGQVPDRQAFGRDQCEASDHPG